MNGNLLAVVKQITAQYGVEVLNNARQLKSLFGDFAKDEPKPLRSAFVCCIEEGAYNALKDAPHAAERSSRKASIAQRVRNEHGIDPAFCAEALDILETALFGTASAAGQPQSASPPATPQPAATRVQPPPAAVQVTPSEPAGFVKINGGTFYMGSPADEPSRSNDEVRHQVAVSSFFMGKYEVTQKEWREVMGNSPSFFKGDNLPVEQVSWYEAVEYCNQRSRREGLPPAYTINGTYVSWNRNASGCRLPTEAEWEYACRAGTSGPFNMGSNMTTSQANYDGNYPYNNNAKGTYRERTVEVGSFAANGWGLYDMHGNVWEWCWDWYGDYSSGSQSDPVGPSAGAYRVRRGGSWLYSAQGVRSAYRFYFTPTLRYYFLGFRLVRSR